MIQDETNPEGIGKPIETEYLNIKGWAVDADSKNDPTYPVIKRTNREKQGYIWERPAQQPLNDEVLKSVERPNLPSVFGTSVPPSGLSGKVRRMAFKYSESSYGRWLPLMLADRINVVEGFLDDLRHGYIPNIFAERGWKSEWKYNRKAFVKKVAVGVLITAGALAFLLYKRKKESFPEKKVTRKEHPPQGLRVAGRS